MAPPLTSRSVRDLGDLALLELQGDLARERRRVDAQSALVAAEIARRSDHLLGQTGLAQRLGARTPENLVQQLAGVSAREAAALVRVGSMADESPLTAAVAGGSLGVDAADAIRSGLGDDAPDAVVLSLIEAAPTSTVERLAVRAREERAALDDAGVVDRERHLREQRYLRLTRVGDGMTRLTGLLDPESAAVVVAAYDGATSPRCGGPRFIDPERTVAVDAVTRDPRTTEQVALDAVVELIRLGGDADPDVLPGRRPSVHLLVTAADLARGTGSAQLEGQSAPVGIETVERVICDGGILPIRFDEVGQPIDVGRDQRTFTARQRVALAARDGGCRFPGCDRPPSWCEAHHLIPWSRGGRTDLINGLMLCRHHHLLIHDQGWGVERAGREYSVVPPRSVDPTRTPIPAPANSPIARKLLAG